MKEFSSLESTVIALLPPYQHFFFIRSLHRNKQQQNSSKLERAKISRRKLMIIHFFFHVCGFLFEKSRGRGGVEEEKEEDCSLSVSLFYFCCFAVSARLLFHNQFRHFRFFSVFFFFNFFLLLLLTHSSICEFELCSVFSHTTHSRHNYLLIMRD